MLDLSKLEASENMPDSGETVCVSPLALLKMLRHGRAGIPLEVMGLMTGAFIDDFTIQITDVYSMPQTGTGVTVEAVDPVYQAEMTNLLQVVNKSEDVVGWYHSHPGFGCWLSSTDMSTQESFERLHKRAIALVIDPIQSVKGKVVVDAFRLINNQFLLTGIEPRQVTNNLGFLTKPSVVALLHGLNRHYYSFRIVFRKTKLETRMLLAVNKRGWAEVLTPKKIEKNDEFSEDMHAYLEAASGKKDPRMDLRQKVLGHAAKLNDSCVISNLLKVVHNRIFSD